MNTTNATGKTEPAARPAAHAYALTFGLLSLVLFWRPLSALAILSFHDERFSHVLLIPLISALLIVLRRTRIFRAPRYCPYIGVPLLFLAVVLWLNLKTPLSRVNNTDRLSVVASLIVLVWIATFILFYGPGPFRAAAFPLLFLLLMIPIPVVLAENTVLLLQKGSAEACSALFRLAGVPFIRHGFQFSLPGVDIEVGEQCSGVHSALSLFIAGLLLQHFLLFGAWKRGLFTLCIFPIAILKNAVRIVTIAWLGIHVNPDFFHGQLHRQGGLPFSVLAIALFGVLLWLLRRPFGSARTHGASGLLNSGLP